MTGLNLGALDELQEAVSSNYNGTFRQQDIPSGGSKEFRLQIPTQENMNRAPMKRVVTHWINNKPYLSLSVFGEECPLEKYYDLIRKSGTREQKNMIDKKSRIFDRTESFIMPALMCTTIYAPDGFTPTGLKVEKGKSIGLEVSRANAAKILAYVSNPKNQQRGRVKGGSESIMNRAKNCSITISKEGSGLGTEYTIVLDDSMDLSGEDYDKYYEETFDIIGYLEEDRKEEAYLEAVARNFFYGDEMPAEYADNDDEKQAAPKASKSKGSMLDNLDNLDD